MTPQTCKFQQVIRRVNQVGVFKEKEYEFVMRTFARTETKKMINDNPLSDI